MIERFEKESAEAERKELERQAALEKKRVEDALDDAVAFRRALDIRTYVDEARAANAGVRDALPPEDFETWASWAVAQADRIDPVRTEAFRRGFVDGPGNKAGDRNRKAATKTLKTDCAINCQTRYALCHLMPNAVPFYAKRASATPGVFGECCAI